MMVFNAAHHTGRFNSMPQNQEFQVSIINDGLCSITIIFVIAFSVSCIRWFFFQFSRLIAFQNVRVFECLSVQHAQMFDLFGFFFLTNLLFLSCCHAIPIDMRHPKIPINLRNVASNSCFKNDFSNCVANVRTYLHEYSI